MVYIVLLVATACKLLALASVCALFFSKGVLFVLTFFVCLWYRLLFIGSVDLNVSFFIIQHIFSS